MITLLRIAIAVAAVGAAASACGSGGAGASASGRLQVHAALRRGACQPVHPGLSPYRGTLVFVRAGGGPVRVVTDAHGIGGASVSPGRYRLVAPLRGSTVHIDLGGHAPTTAGSGYPIRVGAGGIARLGIVILPRRGECTSRGTSA